MRAVGHLPFLVLAAALVGCSSNDLPPPDRDRPSFLVIVADDLGYSDLGAYGSEIPTPNIDALAEAGVVATRFYVSSDGVPTRAMLLTGVDHHLAGFGAPPDRLAPNQEGKPGYEGGLRADVVTVAELLRDAGYATVMAGRWELGSAPSDLPGARGFERSFALHDGAASHWSDMASAIPGRDRAHYTRDDVVVEELPPDYFSTRYITDFTVEAIDAAAAADEPFFAYVSYQAPHGPLAVPEDWRDRFAGRYDEGYDSIRDARLLRMKRMDLVRPEVLPYPGIPTVPRWDDLEDDAKQVQARKMELYAAMVANLDHHVGRLVDHLKEIDEFRNTLVVLMSDNGAESGDRGPAGMDPRERSWYAEQFPETTRSAWGGPDTFVEYGAAWAQVSMVPFRLFKGTMAEGGIRSPLIFAGNPVRRKGRADDELLHVTDVAPTLLELAGIAYPASYRGRKLRPLSGHSLVPPQELLWRLRGSDRQWMAFEYAGDRAIRRGRWKAVWMPPPFGAGAWRLYELERDPAELYDFAEEEPEKLAALVALWKSYAGENNVVLPKPPPAAEPALEGGSEPAAGPAADPAGGEAPDATAD